MKKNILSKLGFFAVLAIFVVGMSSCGDDEITGCTDAEAENYNADAVTSDGSCVYAADKFIGDYVGMSACAGGPIVAGLTNDTLMFSVKESVTGGPNDVLIEIPIQGTPVAFASTVAGDVLTVDALLTGLPFPNPLDPTMTINVDVTATGSQTYDSSDDSTSGTINIVINSTDTGATLDQGSCDISGDKQ